MSKLMDDNETYAKLITSIKPSGKRSLSPLEVASLIERLINEEGKDTAQLLLPIDKDMIGYFLRLKNKESCFLIHCHSARSRGIQNSK